MSNFLPQIEWKAKKGRLQAVVWDENSQKFRVSMIWQVFTVQIAKKEDIWSFLTS